VSDSIPSSDNCQTPWSVYLLRCADGSLYCGIAKDVAKRVSTHNSGKGARYTRARRPVRVVWQQAGFGHGDALRREYAIKQLSRRAKLALLQDVAQHAAFERV